MEKVFDVATTAPRVIASDVTIVSAKHGMALTRTLYDVYEPKIGIVIGVGECIGAPQIHTPFVVAIPFGAWRWRDLLHFFF
jgi:hypothetical protein